MKTFLCVTVGVMLFGSVGYGAHDLTCYEIIEPGGDYVEADSAIIPKLGIANLGNHDEINFPVKFIAIDRADNDTVFMDSTLVDYIGPYPDSIEVELPEWTPEGVCRDVGCNNEGPWVEYALFGIVSLYSDDDRDNDTVRHEVTCLLSHDVGVIAMTWPEPPDEEPDRYDEGSKIPVTATVENFGYHKEYDIIVGMYVHDVDSNDICIWHNRRSIDSLDWRGNESGDPYTVDVTFPPFTIPNEHHFTMSCCTELERDACPKNDCKVRYPPGIVEGAEAFPECFSLEIPGSTISDGCQIRFAVPHTSWVKLDVFDAGGRWVCSLENDVFEPGRHSCSWDRCDACGRKVAAGVYLVRMEADEFKDVCKVVIIN